MIITFKDPLPLYRNCFAGIKICFQVSVDNEDGDSITDDINSFLIKLSHDYSDELGFDVSSFYKELKDRSKPEPIFRSVTVEIFNRLIDYEFEYALKSVLKGSVDLTEDNDIEMLYTTDRKLLDSKSEIEEFDEINGYTLQINQ